GTGGAGTYRGGLGQRIEVGSRLGEDMQLSAAAFERLNAGPAGRADGQDGAPGRVEITDGTVIADKGLYRVPAGERLILRTPGGGGYGPPEGRAPDAQARDAAHGLTTEDGRPKPETPNGRETP
ncbi:hydantoinase B/oxoprolinase family protein, partial [Jannaschia sp.]|nr:hydantoinase B/oxoprolinase family protein [Jannaschia sp.]